MANLNNLNAEIGANYIGDDAQAAITLTNSSTGPGLSVDDLLVTALATIQGSGDIGLTAIGTTNTPVRIGRSAAGASTVALLKLSLGSTASAAVFELAEQAFVSCTTIQFTTVAVAGTGAIRVKYGDNYGWIPVMNDTAVTAAVRG